MASFSRGRNSTTDFTYGPGRTYFASREPFQQCSDHVRDRGGALADGSVVDGVIECPYHGMRYAGDGLCTRIPSLGRSTKPPPRAKVDSYPVQEKYGLIFVFLGDLPAEERPPIMDVTQWDDLK